MIKDVQELVYNKLKNLYNENNIYVSGTPSIFEQNLDFLIIFSEDRNIPKDFADGQEISSDISYDIEIYSKLPDTNVYRLSIDTELTKVVSDGFVREFSGKEYFDNNLNYYIRFLTYKIKN